MTGELSSLLLPPPLHPLCSARDSGGGGRRGSGGGHSRQLYLVSEARHRDHLFLVSVNLSPVSLQSLLWVVYVYSTRGCPAIGHHKQYKFGQIGSETLFTVYR
ncbi:hypothetical protein Peur_047600 [Populus x canadensis]